MYPGRAQKHTPHKHPARDERIDHKSPNDCPFSLDIVGGRMQYAPTWKHSYHTSIKYMYPCRGLLNTPYNHPARDEWIDDESPNDSTAPVWPIGGRIQYAPTQAHLYYPSIKCVYPCRTQKHTPHKHPARDECISHKSPNDCPFLLGMIEGRMQYAPTWAHMYAQSHIAPDNDAHLWIKFSVVSDNNKCLFQELNIVLIDNRYISQSFIIVSINNK